MQVVHVRYKLGLPPRIEIVQKDQTPVIAKPDVARSLQKLYGQQQQPDQKLWSEYAPMWSDSAARGIVGLHYMRPRPQAGGQVMHKSTQPGC